MFETQNHVHALCTAMGSLGGFQPQPVWFANFAQNMFFQILVLSILIYQGGGGLNYPYSLTVAIIFYSLAHFSKYISLGGKPPATVAEKAETAEAAPADNTNTVNAEEYYYNY